ncbi:hypothetical protein F5972_08015 [Microbispora cellulosiformans]|uniref:DUF6504 domain-containing protein n=1 Tax=Microbispora cellulosiformans TaxID=2614688 RepID=A0A5J5K553_9ACTN|nr:DUF6504 family protein [Microbispora cellulosiformans]KAA9379592.1 hypothetical protein F5972_08015 [Microbispora cellulosiformans]
MRWYGEPCRVEAVPQVDDGLRPMRVVWRDRAAVVAQVVEAPWCEAREWWKQLGQPATARLHVWFWRVVAVSGVTEQQVAEGRADGPALELILREDDGNWWVEYVVD